MKIIKKHKLIVFVLTLVLTVSAFGGAFAGEIQGAQDTNPRNMEITEEGQEDKDLNEIQDEENIEEEATVDENDVQAQASDEKISPKAKAEPKALSSNVATLKTQIEEATTDTTINLESGTYAFEMDGSVSPQIVNTKNVKITLVGAADGSTKFVMTDSNVPAGHRFIRVQSGSLEVSNISFTGTAGKNGGIMAGNVTATNSTFINNHATDGVAGGGAIKAYGGDINIENSTFTGNSCAAASDGGAVAAEYSGSVRINNSSFDNNSRIGNNNQYGGAVSVKSPSKAGNVISITNSSFTGNVNQATGTWTRGGAVHILGNASAPSDITIDNVLFKNNKCTSPDNSYGNGGALALMTVSKSKITNCTFIGNSAYRHGGALYFENSTGNNFLANSTFIDNIKSYILGGGGAINAYSSNLDIDSSTLITNNIAAGGSGSKVTIKDSILANMSVYASGTFVYSGNNVARTKSSEAAVAPANVFTAYTAATLQQNSAYNYTAPIKTDGPAFEAVTGTRWSTEGQNGVERKSPKSDAGAHEIAALEEFEVTFDSQGGSPTPDSQTVTEGGFATEPSMNVSKTGNNFEGWYTEANGGGVKWDFDTMEITGDKTLYAKWSLEKYTVSFDTQEGVPTPEDQEVEYNQVATEPTGVTRVGYTTDGWFTEPNGQGTKWDFATSKVTEDITLYAHWDIAELTVTFDSQGGAFTQRSETKEITVDYNSIIGQPGVTKENYTFEGWYTEANGKGHKWDFATDRVLEDITLYADWKEVKEIEKPVKPEKPEKPEEKVKEKSKTVAEKKVTSVAKAKTAHTKTGDNSNPIIFIVLLAGMATIFLAYGIYRRKKSKQ